MDITSLSKTSQTPSTKDSIIFVLGRKWPLTAKEIYGTLKREFAVQITYQAVHKTLNEMLKEETIKKENKKYELNKKWIDDVKKNITDLGDRYKSEKKIDFNNFESQYLEFDDFMKLAQFVIGDFFTNYPNPKNNPSICYWNHVCGMIGLSKEQYDKMKEMFTKTTYYGICKNKTALDGYFAEYYKNMGKKCVNGTKHPFHDETYVCGDFVCQSFLPEDYEKELDDFSKKTREVTPETLQKYASLQFKPNTKCHVIITKNHDFAEQLREYAIKAYTMRNENK